MPPEACPVWAIWVQVWKSGSSLCCLLISYVLEIGSPLSRKHESLCLSDSSKDIKHLDFDSIALYGFFTFILFLSPNTFISRNFHNFYGRIWFIKLVGMNMSSKVIVTISGPVEVQRKLYLFRLASNLSSILQWLNCSSTLEQVLWIRCRWIHFGFSEDSLNRHEICQPFLLPKPRCQWHGHNYIKLRELQIRLNITYQADHNIALLSMAPQFFGTIAKTFEIWRHCGWKRRLLSVWSLKNHLEQFEAASQLNKGVEETFEEEQIFRIDRILVMIQSILPSRPA